MSKFAYDPDVPVTLGDALKRWSEGKLSDRQAMEIGGIEDTFELIETAIMHDVSFPGKLTPEEERQVEEFVAAVTRGKTPSS
ncbi:hypothetical protein [Mesorhizobium sp. SP-1A]|uniref:hypothetical protein n=1 Tax=Mesorhizobium sp. SP-1A TaxID=3077840 RepID=UPI0028F6E4D6|nr:hypothetical protein [Mesorhizobium sp. SP-1A]